MSFLRLKLSFSITMFWWHEKCGGRFNIDLPAQQRLKHMWNPVLWRCMWHTQCDVKMSNSYLYISFGTVFCVVLVTRNYSLTSMKMPQKKIFPKNIDLCELTQLIHYCLQLRKRYSFRCREHNNPKPPRKLRFSEPPRYTLLCGL